VNVRAICDGGFELPVAPAEALRLFTPEGERRWAGPAWDPEYAIAGAEADDTAPGTVFWTESDGGNATWIVLDRGEHFVRYARIAPGRVAGTIAVACEPSGEGCRVRVRYDATSIGPDGVAFVQELESGFDGFMAEWRRAVLAA
jgi:hypothetical protein